MKSAKDILAEAASQPNDELTRGERLKQLSEFCDRVIEFRDELHKRGRGPSLKEIGRILDDLEHRIVRIRFWDTD